MSLHSLLVGASSVLAGSAVAALQGCLVEMAMVLCFLFVALIQLTANLCGIYNDLNYNRGAAVDLDLRDNSSTGWSFKQIVREAIIGCLILAALVGFPIMTITNNPWWILVMAIVGLFIVANTMGPRPLGRSLWGVLVAFLTFGPLVVLGTYFVQVQYVDVYKMIDTQVAFSFWRPALFLSFVVGLFSVVILLINTYSVYRIDLENLRVTFTTKFGTRITRIAIFFLNLIGCGWSIYVYWRVLPLGWWIALSGVSLFVFLLNTCYVLRHMYRRPRSYFAQYQDLEIYLMFAYFVLVFVAYVICGKPGEYHLVL